MVLLRITWLKTLLQNIVVMRANGTIKKPKISFDSMGECHKFF